MSNPFLQMWNKHAKACGVPPTISNEASKNYFAYFEAKHGEQWVFVYDREKKTGELRGGDVGWSNPLVVTYGRVAMTLNDEEVAWLQACWSAATWRSLTEKSPSRKP